MIDTIAATLSDIASGGLLGGAVGILGTWLKGREERELLKIKQGHELAMREASRAEMELEATLSLKQTEAEFAGKQAIAQTEADAAKEVAAASLMSASYQQDRASYGIKAVDAIRGLMRPLITLYLLGVMTAIAWHLYNLDVIAAVSPGEAWSLFSVVARDATFLAVTAVTWWFGTRPTTHRG